MGAHALAHVVSAARRAKLGGMNGFRPSAANCASLVFALSVLSLSPRASAYCRTITLSIPASVDQTTTCYDPPGAIPLWWSGQCVGFSVQQNASTQISLGDAESHALAAFERWMNASCPSGGSPSIIVSDEGPVACDEVGYSEVGPNQHVIIFRDTSWPYSDRYNTLALTTVTFDTDTGEIYDADMEINTSKTTITVNEPAGAGEYDFDSIITHEAGHFLGMAHSPLDTAVMFAHYKAGSTALTSDDVAGICTIYEPGGARATEQDAGTAIVPVSVQEETPCDPTPRHGFGSQCGPRPDAGDDDVVELRDFGGAGSAGARRLGWPMVALLGGGARRSGSRDGGELLGFRA